MMISLILSNWVLCCACSCTRGWGRRCSRRRWRGARTSSPLAVPSAAVKVCVAPVKSLLTASLAESESIYSTVSLMVLAAAVHPVTSPK